MSRMKHSVLNLIYISFFILCCYLQGIQGIITDVTVNSANYFAQYVQKSFGLADGGRIEIDYDIRVKDENLGYNNYILIIIMNEEQRLDYYDDIGGSSSKINSNIDYLCTLPSMHRQIIQTLPASGSYNYTISKSNGGTDQYTVAVLQCRSSTPQGNSIHAYVKATTKNIDPSGTGYNQLDIQDVMLVRLYLGEIFIYTLLLIGIVAQIYFAKNYALALHRLFAATIFSYFILYIVKYYGMKYTNNTGNNSLGLDYASNLIAVFVDTLSLASLFYLSLGWSTIRQQLSQKEHNLINYAISGFFLFDLGAAVCNDSSNQACEGLSLVSFIIKSLVLLAIIIAMNFTVTQLRAMLTHTPWVPSTPIQYARCKQFQIFRLLFILYLLLPTAFLIVQVTMYSWEDDWVMTVLNDFLTILIIFHIGVTFSPLHEPLLVRAFDGTGQARPANARPE